MSTPAALIIKTPDWKYHSIYVHFDGYIDGVGCMLLWNWKKPADVFALAKKNLQINSLKRTLSETDFLTAPSYVFSSYKEALHSAKSMATIIYRFTGERWRIASGDTFRWKQLQACLLDFSVEKHLATVLQSGQCLLSPMETFCKGACPAECAITSISGGRGPQIPPVMDAVKAAIRNIISGVNHE